MRSQKRRLVGLTFKFLMVNTLKSVTLQHGATERVLPVPATCLKVQNRTVTPFIYPPHRLMEDYFES